MLLIHADCACTGGLRELTDHFGYTHQRNATSSTWVARKCWHIVSSRSCTS